MPHHRRTIIVTRPYITISRSRFQYHSSKMLSMDRWVHLTSRVYRKNRQGTPWANTILPGVTETHVLHHAQGSNFTEIMLQIGTL